MVKFRKAIPRKLSNLILYKSAAVCCICRTKGMPVEIHHIDQNPSNNVEKNLVALCRNCHDESHTTHTMSKNLTQDRLIDAKSKWEKEVIEESSYAMKASSNLTQSVWTFLNHQRLPHVMKAYGVQFNEGIFSVLRSTGSIDNVGIPILSKKPLSNTHVSIYDRLDYDDSHRLHYLYSEAIDDLIEASNPIELGAIWTRTEIRNIVSPGDLCFCMRGFRFKEGKIHNQEEDRSVYAKARGIRVQFMANTRHMFGTSALYDSFTGHRVAAVLIMVKNIAIEDGILVIRATPLAMGSGFLTGAYKTPYKIKYGLPNNDGKL